MARNKKSHIANDILRRVRWLYFIFLFVAVLIFGRIIFIQYGPQGAELRAKAHKKAFTWINIPGERGDILARDGRVLGTSVPRYEIRMDLAADGLTDEIFNNNIDGLANSLSSFFKDKSAAAYKKKITAARKQDRPHRDLLVSPRRVTYQEEKIIRQFPMFSLGSNTGGYKKTLVSERIRPHGSLAQRTIGMTNMSGAKVGIEGAFDEQLKGTEGRQLRQRVSGNIFVNAPDPRNVEPVNGMDVVSTIDIELQDVAETALKEQLEEKNADWGTVMLMEVATGEIHAMANITRKSAGVYVEDFNYAIGRRMEPGSTFKLATLITLLEDAKMSLDKTIDCENGVANVGARRNIRDDHKEGVISLRRIFEVSSNIGFAKAVYEAYGDKPARFVDFIKKIGFGSPLGIDIPGEQNPLIKHPDDKNLWDKTSLVMMSYGYALEITPMHTLAFYNAVANGGKLVRPKLVKEISSYGQTVKKFGTEVINPSICSQQTIKLARECLEGVVDDGTARRILKNPYYTVAAKTGTAQMPFDNGGYTDRHGGRNYLATMVGYFPADNPKYTCIVAMKTYYGPGRRQTYYGASLSGPVFRAVADRVYAANSSWHEQVGNDKEKTQVPADDIKSGKWPELKRVASKLSISLPANNNAGEWIYITAPEDTVGQEGTKPEGAAAAVIEPGESAKDVMPSVIGMGLKDAIYLLESKGLVVAFSGRGAVKSQSVTAGSPVVKGQVVQIKLGI